MSRTVIINSDKPIGYLDDHKGHTLVGVREWDPGTAVKPERVYVLEFSDEPAQEQLLTIEEQQLALECFKVRARYGNGGEYDALHSVILDRLIPDMDGGE